MNASSLASVHLYHATSEADPDFSKRGPSFYGPLDSSIFSTSNGDYDQKLPQTFPLYYFCISKEDRVPLTLPSRSAPEYRDSEINRYYRSCSRYT